MDNWHQLDDDDDDQHLGAKQGRSKTETFQWKGYREGEREEITI